MPVFSSIIQNGNDNPGGGWNDKRKLRVTATILWRTWRKAQAVQIPELRARLRVCKHWGLESHAPVTQPGSLSPRQRFKQLPLSGFPFRGADLIPLLFLPSPDGSTESRQRLLQTSPRSSPQPGRETNGGDSGGGGASDAAQVPPLFSVGLWLAPRRILEPFPSPGSLSSIRPRQGGLAFWVAYSLRTLYFRF